MDLLPCPFCGSNVIRKDWCDGYPCECLGCKTVFDLHQAQTWNTRAPDDRVQLLAKALREAQKALAQLVNSEAIQQTTVINAYAQVKAAECNARTALRETGLGE